MYLFDAGIGLPGIENPQIAKTAKGRGCGMREKSCSLSQTANTGVGDGGPDVRDCSGCAETAGGDGKARGDGR